MFVSAVWNKGGIDSLDATRLAITSFVAIDLAQTHTNFSSGLVLWEYLHGTARWADDETGVTVGVAGYLEPSTVTLRRIITLPISAGDV